MLVGNECVALVYTRGDKAVKGKASLTGVNLEREEPERRSLE